MTESPHEPRRNRWPLILGVTAVLLVLLLLIFGGNPERPHDQPPQAGAGATAQTPEDQCRRQLAGILDGLRPERLGVSVGVDAMVDDLNIWWTDCGAKSHAAVAAPPDEARPLLGEQAALRAAATTFDARDAGHIRLSLLCRVVADKLKAVPIVNKAGQPIKPSLENVVNGSYEPLSRPIFIYVSDASAKRPEVRKFVDYYLAESVPLIEEVKYVPLPKQAYDLASKHFEEGKLGTGFGGVPEVGLKVEELLAREAKL